MTKVEKPLTKQSFSELSENQLMPKATSTPISGEENTILTSLEMALNIIIALKSRPMRIDEIADCFNVNIRTAYRYVNTIAAVGLTMERDGKARYRIISTITL